MALVGSLANLKAINSRIAKLPKTLALKAAAKAAVELTSLAKGSNAGRSSVYGDAYPGGVSCVKSGATVSSLVFKSDGGTKVRCALSTPYAKYLIRYGLLPNAGAAMPASWFERLVQIVNQAGRAL